MMNLEQNITDRTDTVKRMTESLIHRGPDDEAYYRSPDGHVFFGHRRLSIVGLDDRPTLMTVAKKEKPMYQLALTFNGEIYNYDELKRIFREKGYRSVSPSDFEVILFAWQEWGRDCVDHLIGEFAFVLYDEETGETFFARDRTGVKPLFYALLPDGTLLFASEPKALLASGEMKTTMDVQSLAAFVLGSHTFAAGTPGLSASFFEGIQQLPAAHTAIFTKQGLQLKRYWELPFSDTVTIVDHVTEIRTVLTASIEARIPQEVKTSVALSGGLDSSIVTAVAHRSRKTKELLASSVQYTGDQNEDYRYARILSEALKIPLSGPVLDAKTLVATIDACVQAMDGPFDTIRRMGMFANYEQMHHLGYKVALIGEGADEFNLGYYHKFPGLKLDRERCQNPEAFAELIQSRTEYVSHFFTKDFLKKIDWTELIHEDVRENYEQCQSIDPLKRMQYYYAKKFLAFLEDSNDRMAMAHSVEARLPFVDPDVIGVCLRIPSDQQISDDNEKRILREAFKEMLPKKIAERRKAPFPASKEFEVHELIAKSLAENIEQIPVSIWKILDREAVSAFSSRYSAKIEEIKRGQMVGSDVLNSWLSMSGPVEVRTSQAMCFLTILRWYQLYFV